MKISTEQKEEIIKRLKPLIEKINGCYCFGSSSTFNPTTGTSIDICQCSGADYEGHIHKMKRQSELRHEMVSIVSEIVGEEAMLFPGTYSDLWFCIAESWNGQSAEGIISVDGSGKEITEPRSWA